NQTLADIGAGDKQTILVFNKIDAFTFEEKEADDLTPLNKRNLSLEQLKNSWMSKLNSPVLFISAGKKQNIEEFKKVLYENIKELHQVRYPYNKFLY
ncbi:MAG TPA: GTPase HflX, partial [Bacteroidia bacterium]|nr:GTPase HflX [Bacteroidia bacterium]